MVIRVGEVWSLATITSAVIAAAQLAVRVSDIIRHGGGYADIRIIQGNDEGFGAVTIGIITINNALYQFVARAGEHTLLDKAGLAVVAV